MPIQLPSCSPSFRLIFSLSVHHPSPSFHLLIFRIEMLSSGFPLAFSSTRAQLVIPDFEFYISQPGTVLSRSMQHSHSSIPSSDCFLLHANVCIRIIYVELHCELLIRSANTAHTIEYSIERREMPTAVS